MRRILNDCHILLIDLHGILIPEWGLANEKLIYQNAESPPVNSAAVPGVLNCLRCKIFLDYLARVEWNLWLKTHTGVPQRVYV